MRTTNRRWAAPLLGLLLTTGACGDLLEENPAGSVSPSNFYKNAEDALTALNSSYANFHNPFYMAGFSYVFMVETPTPQIVGFHGPTSVRGCFDVFMCQPDKSGGYENLVWREMYKMVNKDNAVIDNVSKIKDMDTGLRARIVAEAKFLRAIHYFNAVRLWGGVPLRTSETASLRDLESPRNTADEVYDFLIKDLTDAAKDLPVSYPASEFGRATRGAAQTLLAKVYLQRGVAGKTNPFGDKLYWPTAKATDIQNAITNLRAVINSGQYSLVENYGDLWNEATEMNSEVIFSVQNSTIPWQGMTINHYLAPPKAPWLNSWTSAGAELPFYQSYEKDDKRRDVSWVTEYTQLDGKKRVYNENKIEQIWPTPALRKYLIERSDIGGHAVNPRDLVVLRYADVLLMLAEALLEQGQTGGEALRLVNQVRERAGIAPLASLDREALYKERSWEFVQEQQGWYDGQRFWDLMTRDIVAHAKLGQTNPKKYPRRTVPQVVPKLTDKDRLMPIPVTAMDRNPQLVQNPGW